MLRKSRVRLMPYLPIYPFRTYVVGIGANDGTTRKGCDHIRRSPFALLFVAVGVLYRPFLYRLKKFLDIVP